MTETMPVDRQRILQERAARLLREDAKKYLLSETWKAAQKRTEPDHNESTLQLARKMIDILTNAVCAYEEAVSHAASMVGDAQDSPR